MKEYETEFWRDVYMASFHTYQDAGRAAKEANAALNALRDAGNTQYVPITMTFTNNVADLRAK